MSNAAERSIMIKAVPFSLSNAFFMFSQTHNNAVYVECSVFQCRCEFLHQEYAVHYHFFYKRSLILLVKYSKTLYNHLA